MQTVNAGLGRGRSMKRYRARPIPMGALPMADSAFFTAGGAPPHDLLIFGIDVGGNLAEARATTRAPSATNGERP